MNRFDRGRHKRKWREPSVTVPGVSSVNLPIWLAKTVAVDVRDYDRGRRPLTLARLRASLPPRVRRPIFVVGAPRSGTSFLGGCIGSLGSVSYHREPVIMKAVGRQVTSGEWDQARATAVYQRAYRTLLGLHLAGDLRLADKSPHNSFIVRSLAAAFPDAQFIHIVRDGRDAAVSYLEKPWVRQVYAWTRRRDPGGQPYGPFAPFWVERDRVAEFESTSDLHRAVWAWRAHVEAARDGGADMPADRWLDVRYETILKEPETEAARLLEFLGAEGDDDEQQLRTALADANPASIGRWHDQLAAADIAVIEREAGDLLAGLGYT
jgi:hypothetical protein